MIDFTAFNQACLLLFTSFDAWYFVIPGMIIGLVFGAIPGLQISMAMALFLPLTWSMTFVQAMIFLTAIFTGGAYGGGVTAILMNIPGSSSSVATAFDGYPMAQQGKHSQALGLGLAASAVGSLIGYILLFLLIGPISNVVLKMGPLEMVAVVFWGLGLIATLNNGSVAKGLLAGSFGLVISQFGLSTTGIMRTTFGNPYLLNGVDVIPAMIGAFAASELFNIRGKKYLIDDESARHISFKGIFAGMRNIFRYPSILLRGSFLGAGIGAVPGVGSSVANLIAYSEAKRKSKTPERFGKGAEEGVIAAESANSSSEGGSMIALLALGIPGGAATAVLLAAFNYHNITGGPSFVRQSTDIVYAIIFSNFIQIFLLLILGLLFIRLLGMVVRIPLSYLAPTVLVLCAWGGFGISGTLAGPITVFSFGVIGWVMRQNGYPIAAMVIGLILGRMTEGELVRTVQISGGDPTYIFERPIAMLFFSLLILFLLIIPVYKEMKKRS